MKSRKQTNRVCFKRQMIRLWCTLVTVLAGSVSAETFTWSTNTTGAAQDGAGAWDTTTLNWVGAGDAHTAWNNATGDTAIFGAGGSAGTVTALSGITLGGLTFNAVGSGFYTLAGGPLILTGTPTITANTSATISSVLEGSSGLTKSGAGTLTLTAENTYSGTTTINGGTLALAGGNNRLNTAAGVISINAGTLDLGGNTQAMTSGYFSMANGTTLQNGTINYKNENWGPNGGASVTFGTGGGFNCLNRLILNGSTTLTLAAGAGASSFGGDSAATCNFIGVDAGNANTVVVNGGSLNFTNRASGSGYLRLGSNGGAGNPPRGTVSVNNGTVNVGHSMSMGTFYNMGNAPSYGIATLTLNGGEVAVGTGSDRASLDGTFGALALGNGHPDTLSQSTVNLNGGTLSLNQLQGGLYGLNTVNFNGGTLKARTNNTAFVTGSSLVCKIGPGAALIDTDGFTIGIDAPFSGDGNLVKQGSGSLVLTGGNSHNGLTSVEAGKLTLSPFGDANLKLHLDASDSSSLFANADGTGAVNANGDPVGYWGDLSGNNKPAKQSASASRPTYTNNVADFNGRSALYFDGSNDDMTSLLDINPAKIPNMTIMIVYKQLEKVGNAALWGHDDNGFDRLQMFDYNANYYLIGMGGSGTTVKGMETNKVTVYTAVLQDGVPAGSSVYLNGVRNASIGLPSFTSTDYGGHPSITFGNIAAGSGFYGKVLIGEVLVFDTVLGPTAQSNVVARLSNKWLGTSVSYQSLVNTNTGPMALAEGTLANLKLRLDASESSSLFTNATGVGAVTTTGEPVGYWGDLSGNNKPALQAADAARPTYVTGVAGFNNLPVLQFDGSDDELTSALNISPGSIPNLTVMMVFRQVTYKVSGALWGHDDGGYDRFQLLNYGSIGNNYISTSGGMTSANGMNTNTLLLYTAVLRNGVANSSYVYINGQSDAANGLFAFTSSMGDGQPSFTLADIAQNGGLRGNIQIGEVLVFDTALSYTARLNAETYLKDKWVGMLPGRGSVNISSGAVLDLDGAAQPLVGVTGAGTLSNGTLIAAQPLSPAGASIGTLKVSDMAFDGILLSTVALDGSCDQLVGSGSLNLTGLTLQIANIGLLNKDKRYTIVTCSGSLTGELIATLPKNWNIKYDRTVGAGTVTLVYIPPGTMIRFM